MSAAEVLAQIEALPEAERKIVERALRRLNHPDVPEEIWEGYEDSEDGHTVDMETALFEEPPPEVLDRSLRAKR